MGNHTMSCCSTASVADLDIDKKDLAKKIGQVDYAESAKDCSKGINCSHMCCGTPSSAFRDPLRGKGNISTGLVDVTGRGKVDCGDCHDALFLSYPSSSVKHSPVPANSAQEFKDMQLRYAAIVDIEDVRDDTGMRFEEIHRHAEQRGIDPVALQKAMYWYAKADDKWDGAGVGLRSDSSGGANAAGQGSSPDELKDADGAAQGLSPDELSGPYNPSFELQQRLQTIESEISIMNQRILENLSHQHATNTHQASGDHRKNDVTGRTK